MLRPDDSHSARPAAANAIRSGTCSPIGSITRNCCPRNSVNAVPLCGSILRRSTVADGVEGTSPLGADAASRILARLRAGAEVGEHRIAVALEPHLGVADDALEPRVAAVLAQRLEL